VNQSVVYVSKFQLALPRRRGLASTRRHGDERKHRNIRLVVDVFDIAGRLMLRRRDVINDVIVDAGFVIAVGGRRYFRFIHVAGCILRLDATDCSYFSIRLNAARRRSDSLQYRKQELNSLHP